MECAETLLRMRSEKTLLECGWQISGSRVSNHHRGACCKVVLIVAVRNFDRTHAALLCSSAILHRLCYIFAHVPCTIMDESHAD